MDSSRNECAWSVVGDAIEIVKRKKGMENLIKINI